MTLLGEISILFSRPASTLLELLPIPKLAVFVLELPAVPVGGAHHVVLLVAVVLCRLGPLAPQLLALVSPSGTVSVEAESLLPAAVRTAHPVLDEEVCRALAGVARAELVQVTLARAVPTHCPSRHDLTQSVSNTLQHIKTLIIIRPKRFLMRIRDLI